MTHTKPDPVVAAAILVVFALISLGCLTKYHRMGGLSTTETCVSQFWRLKPNIRMPAWPGLGPPLVEGASGIFYGVTNPF